MVEVAPRAAETATRSSGATPTWRHIARPSSGRTSCMSEERIRRRVRVRGDVQGVFFRETTRRKASDAGVAGWVANRSDGSVEAVFEGPADAVESMLAYAREGPTAANVESVDVTEESPEGPSGFEVR